MVILQDEAPIDTMVELMQSNPPAFILVLAVWALGAMYGYWAAFGRENVEPRLIGITFGIICVLLFGASIFIYPEIFATVVDNPAGLIAAVGGSAIFGVLIMPTVVLIALGAMTGLAMGRR